MNDRNDDKTQTHVVLSRGTMVNHYRIAEKVGAGGMGEVYLAEDTKLSRRVAMKFMPAHLAADEDMRTRFTREAQTAARLDHPNIVPVYEVGEFFGRPFIAMAYIEGKSLRDIIKDSKLSVSESIALTMQICEGLQKAHEASVVHRDIKPGNIIIDNSGRARILDFGLAAVTGEDKLTKTGSTLGTVGYMAPEQISGGNVDMRSDLFSIGVILYEMLTGRRPFEGDNDAAVVRAITDLTPEPIARFKSGVTGELQRIIDKALAKNPSLRYQHADDMLADLKRLDVFKPVPKKKKTALWAISVLAVLVIGYLTATLLVGTEQWVAEEPPVIVVLPFKNLGASEGDHFSEGIADEISSRLALITEIRVISRSSAARYRDSDKDAQEIGSELGAHYVIDGTIRWDKSGKVDRIRITPQLIKTGDGYLMWADNYEQELSQIFIVQAEIASKIVTALGLTLLEPGEKAPEYAPTENMAAYNYYLRGLDISNRSILMSNLVDAIRMFDSAVALDPDFALAWAHKSATHSEFNFTYTTVNAAYHRREAKAAAEKALALDPNLSMGHIAMGTYYNMVGTDYENALASFTAAKSEVTSNAALSEGIGIVRMRQGRWQEALSKLEEAVRIDPLNTRRYLYLANCYAMIRDYESAGRYIDRALILDPSNPDAASFRLHFNLLEYGSIEGKGKSFDSLSKDAGLAKIVTYEVASNTSLGLWRFITDRIDPREAIESTRNIAHERSPHTVFLNIGQIYDHAGLHDSAMIFYDSARIILENVIDLGDPDFHVYCELGIAHALLGRVEDAIAAGKKGMEMMPVDLCHW